MNRLVPAGKVLAVPPFRRRRTATLLLATALGVLAPALAACGAGPNAQTAQFYSPGDGVNAIEGQMRVLNALVVAPATAGQDAVVSMMLANDGTQPEVVTEVLTERYGPVRLTGDKVVPARGVLLYGAETTPAQAIIPGFTGKPGEVVTLTVRFARNAPIAGLETVVVPPTGYFGDLQIRKPTTVPTPSVTAPQNPAGSPPVTNPSAPAGTGGAEPVEPGL